MKYTLILNDENDLSSIILIDLQPRESNLSLDNAISLVLY